MMTPQEWEKEYSYMYKGMYDPEKSSKIKVKNYLIYKYTTFDRVLSSFDQFTRIIRVILNRKGYDINFNPVTYNKFKILSRLFRVKTYKVIIQSIIIGYKYTPPIIPTYIPFGINTSTLELKRDPFDGVIKIDHSEANPPCKYPVRDDTVTVTNKLNTNPFECIKIK